jgi:HAE1 family hydrophobic/amphiphilic exporter-1
MTCLVILSLVAGLACMSRLGVDLFPDVTFPVVTVTIPYPGAGPSEVETLVSKPVEDELATLSGIKRLSSNNMEGVSVVVAEFTLETDVKYAEQQIRDRVGATKRKLPTDIQEPVIRRIDPADQPILTVGIKADLPEAKLYDLANEVIKPKLEQVNQVGLVEIIGGRKREIHVSLDRNKLKKREISASQVAQRINGAGEDIPAGKKSEGNKETIFRTVGQFSSVDDIRNLMVNFFGNDVPTRVGDVGTVVDSLADETTRAYTNSEKALFINAYRQSGANTIKVVKSLKDRIAKLNSEIKSAEGKPEIVLIRDGSLWIQANVDDVYESILIGIALAVIVVYVFLGSARSTVITGLALPNSLIGAFILMALAGFSINIMTLLALSLSVGLLIDDAIVVRENIFRHVEMGKKPIAAALIGTAEVRLAVIATTLTVIAVFGPLGFLKGVVGQFFKQFGLTVCFAMLISLFDALTVAPMLSAYFAGPNHLHTDKDSLYGRTIGACLRGFDRFQTGMENVYESFLKLVLRRPLLSLFASIVIFIACVSLARFVPKTFLPAQDAGEFSVAIDLAPGTNLDAMDKMAQEIDHVIRSNPEVDISALTVGSKDGDPNQANFYVKLVPAKQRKVNTSELKERLREQLKPFAIANPKVKDFDPMGGGIRPFALNISGTNQEELEKFAAVVLERLKKHPGLKDVDISFRPGKPEFQVRPEKSRAQLLGTSTAAIGLELRTQIEGSIAAKYREKGIEYDVRVRLQDDQRNLKENFPTTFVPNLNGSLVRLTDVAKPIEATGPSKITRMDRNRYVQIGADITPGAGIGDVVKDVTQLLKTELEMPKDVNFYFIGQAENFAELGESMAFAMLAGIIFIFMVLASLYESFVTPFTIMLALPLAVAGSFVALFLSGQSLNIFSMIGIIMLLGVATKNSILLVDYANHLRTDEGLDRATAIIRAGKVRLRPILMTTMALIAGTIPIALGLNEASRQRTSMGWAIIGGLVSSTLLTLIVVPAAYSYIDRFREWAAGFLGRLFMSKDAIEDSARFHKKMAAEAREDRRATEAATMDLSPTDVVPHKTRHVGSGDDIEV